jgi:hypothetical protein
VRSSVGLSGSYLDLFPQGLAGLLILYVNGWHEAVELSVYSFMEFVADPTLLPGM